MNSADRAKERLITDIERCGIKDCECSTEKDPLGDTLDALGKEIQELKHELAVKEAAIKGLVEENAMLEKRTITIQQGKQDEIDGWRGKLAKANIELDRLRRNEHNRNAFAEAGK